MPPPMSSLLFAKRALAMVHDLVAVIVCWYAAYWLRFNLDLPEFYLKSASRELFLVLSIHAPLYLSLIHI